MNEGRIIAKLAASGADEYQAAAVWQRIQQVSGNSIFDATPRIRNWTPTNDDIEDMIVGRLESKGNWSLDGVQEAYEYVKRVCDLINPTGTT